MLNGTLTICNKCMGDFMDMCHQPCYYQINHFMRLTEILHTANSMMENNFRAHREIIAMKGSCRKVCTIIQFIPAEMVNKFLELIVRW